MRIAVLQAEAEIEQERARGDAEAGLLLQAYLNGWKLRKTAAEADVAEIEAEEEGARDALTGALEELKKFEHVAETTRRNRLIAAGKREAAAFDELGLRRRAGGPAPTDPPRPSRRAASPRRLRPLRRRPAGRRSSRPSPEGHRARAVRRHRHDLAAGPA